MAANLRCSRTLRHEAPDSDTESEDGSQAAPVPTMADTERNLSDRATIMMMDIGSWIRDEHTKAGPKAKPVNVRALLDARECNQAGSEAANLATMNKKQIGAWNNYVNTADAKSASVEALSAITGGNSHREGVQRKLAEEASRRGGKLKLEDTYDERGPGSRIPPPFSSRGAAASSANDRGHFSKARGGGFAGRGGGRGGRGPVKSGDRPLDPAVDPDRRYNYSSGPAFRPERPKKGPSKPAAQDVNTGPTLSSPTDFMATVNKLMTSRSGSNTYSIVNTLASAATAQPSIGQEGQVSAAAATKSATQAANEAEKVPMSTAELRNPQALPDKMTDANPSLGLSKLSTTNGASSIKKGTTAGPGNKDVVANASPVLVPTENLMDLTDLEIPAVKTEALAPSPTEEMTAVSKADAELLKRVKAFISRSGSMPEMIDFIKSKGLGTDGNAMVSSPSPTLTSDNLKSFASGNIIGDSSWAPNSSLRTTSSLSRSKWAPAHMKSAGETADMGAISSAATPMNPFKPREPEAADADSLDVTGQPILAKEQIVAKKPVPIIEQNLTLDQKIVALTQEAPPKADKDANLPSQSKTNLFQSAHAAPTKCPASIASKQGLAASKYATDVPITAATAKPPVNPPSGLLASKYATQPSAVTKPASTVLQAVPINTNARPRPNVTGSADSEFIFGDAKTWAGAKSSNKPHKTGTKRSEPGPGFLQLMQDLKQERREGEMR